MNEETLKALAKEYGYYLLKAEKYEKMLPCTCGCKKRRRWYGADGIVAECKKCKKQTPACNTEAEVRHAWNEMVRKETENASQSR